MGQGQAACETNTSSEHTVCILNCTYPSGPSMFDNYCSSKPIFEIKSDFHCSISVLSVGRALDAYIYYIQNKCISSTIMSIIVYLNNDIDIYTLPSALPV
jgi:hypothetical protein